VNSSVSVTESLEYLSGWKKKKKARSPSQLEWEILAESARISPSAANKQQWKFILIQEETLLRDLRGLLKERRTLGGIIACIGMTSLPLLERGLERPFWMIDLPIAISSITLMAGALDFLARVYVDEIPEKQVNSLLQLESDWRTVGLVGLR
jgi:nitroreductase